MLGNQQPLPRAKIKFVYPKEIGHNGAIIPLKPYNKEELKGESSAHPLMNQFVEPKLSPTIEVQYQIEHNTLWFIVMEEWDKGSKQLHLAKDNPN